MTMSPDLKENCPYEKAAAYIAKLVVQKQAAYGNSFDKAGEAMRLFYPDGIKPDQMDDALCIVRILDKLFRIATDKDALGESPYGDISGYGLLGMVMDKRRKILEGKEGKGAAGL